MALFRRKQIMEKTIIESLWKQGHTKMAIEYAKEKGIEQEELVKIVYDKERIMSKQLAEEIHHAKQFQYLDHAKEFVEDNFKNCLIASTKESSRWFIIPQYYLKELLDHDYECYILKANNKWVKA